MFRRDIQNQIILPLKFRLIPIKRQKFKFAKEGSLKSKNERKETSLRIKKYKEKSVSQYVKWTFLILPPNSMHPTGDGNAFLAMIENF